MHRLYHYSVHELSKVVLRYIRKQDLLGPGDRVGVAVSGGADSVALLRLLLELRAELGVVLSVIHVNHCLRGAESDGDERFVAALAAEYDLPLFCARRDVKSYAAETKLSIETTAREVRYEYFQELLQNGEFNRVATAHTLDDQAETVLLKLTRGAGTRGLAGIYPRIEVGNFQKRLAKAQPCKSDLTIVRPLLGITRSVLEDHLNLLKQPWREDSTNAQLQHTRNRIRHEIVPKLSDVNPQVRRTLAEVAEIARAEEEFWREEVQRHLAEVWVPSRHGGTLRLSKLKELPLALRRRLVRAAAESLGLNLEFRHVEEALSMSERRGIVLPNGWRARRVGDWIRFDGEVHRAAEDYQYDLPVPGRVEVPEAGVILVTALPDKERYSSHDASDPTVDSHCSERLVVRNWRAGDRFWPANSKGPKKVKELLQDRHITGEEKKRWPVIVSGELVVWMRGLGIARGAWSQNGGVLIRDEAINPKGSEPRTDKLTMGD